MMYLSLVSVVIADSDISTNIQYWYGIGIVESGRMSIKEEYSTPILVPWYQLSFYERRTQPRYPYWWIPLAVTFTFRWCSNAASQPQYRQTFRPGLNHLCTLFASHPVRDFNWLWRKIQRCSSFWLLKFLKSNPGSCLLTKMNVQPVLCHRAVHILDGHLQALWAADSAANGVGKVGQAIVWAVLGSSKNSQIDDLLGRVGVCCYLCWYFWLWDRTIKTKVLLIHNFGEVFP